MVGVLEKEQIAYFGLHKAAGTTIKKALFALREGRPWQATDPKLHPQFPSIKITQSHFDKFRDYWTFTVIRDPIKRFLSGYQNRVHDYKDLANTAFLKPDKSLVGRIGKLLSRPRYFPEFEPFPSIENLIANFDNYCRVSDQIFVHTCSAQWFIGNDLSYFDKVYTTSNLDELARDLSERTGQVVTFSHENKSSSPPPRFEELSETSQRFLLEHTKDDYRLFKDYYEPPALTPQDQIHGQGA